MSPIRFTIDQDSELRLLTEQDASALFVLIEQIAPTCANGCHG